MVVTNVRTGKSGIGDHLMLNDVPEIGEAHASMMADARRPIQARTCAVSGSAYGDPKDRPAHSKAGQAITASRSSYGTSVDPSLGATRIGGHTLSGRPRAGVPSRFRLSASRWCKAGNVRH